MADALITHAFLSPYLDGPDATKLQPSAWNAALLLSGGVAGQVLARDLASATGASWVPSPAPDLSGLVLTTDLRLSDARVPLAHTHAFADLTAKPSTLAGYGILDPIVLTSDARLSDARVPLAHTQAFSTITGLPTSLAGYGILDAVVLGTRLVNGHTLSADVTVTKGDLGLGAVENTALSTGNAATATLAAAATILQTARAINGVDFNGSAPITVTAAAGTLTGATLAANVLASSLTSLGTLAALTATGILTTSVNGIAAVDTDGLVLQNATPATAAIPVQQGPRLRVRGQVWNTTAVATSNTDDWWLEGVPTSGATPSSTFKVGKSLNGGTVTYPLTLSSAGLLVVRDGIFGANGNWGITSAGGFTLPAAGTMKIATRFALGSGLDGTLGLSNDAITLGVGLDFATDAVLKIRTRAHSAYATLDALAYRASGVAGVSFGPGPIASITIVNGIVTACS